MAWALLLVGPFLPLLGRCPDSLRNCGAGLMAGQGRCFQGGPIGLQTSTQAACRAGPVGRQPRGVPGLPWFGKNPPLIGAALLGGWRVAGSAGG